MTGGAGVLFVGGELDKETGDAPKDLAQPQAGLVQKATCSFSGCLLLLKHTYCHTLGTATPTQDCTKTMGWAGVESGGLSPSAEVGFEKNIAPATPCQAQCEWEFTTPPQPHTKPQGQ